MAVIDGRGSVDSGGRKLVDSDGTERVRLNRFIASPELLAGTMANDGRRRTGSAGRFGARYGRVARKRVAEIEHEMRSSKVDGDDVKRIGTGIWKNEETGEVFTGGSYRPETPAGSQVTRSIRAAISDDE